MAGRFLSLSYVSIFIMSIGIEIREKEKVYMNQRSSPIKDCTYGIEMRSYKSNTKNDLYVAVHKLISMSTYS
jgi:hypothetical protein